MGALSPPPGASKGCKRRPERSRRVVGCKRRPERSRRGWWALGRMKYRFSLMIYCPC